MGCNWPYFWDNVGNNGYPVRLWPEIDSKSKIAEPQSLKKGVGVRTVGKLRGSRNRVFAAFFVKGS